MRLFLLMAILPSLGWAISGPQDRIADRLLKVELASRPVSVDPRVSVVVELRGAAIPVSRELVTEAVLVSLRQRAIRAKRYAGDLRTELEIGRLGEHSATDKVLVDVTARQVAAGIYALEYSVAYVGFVATSSGPVMAWSKAQQSGGVLPAQVEQTIIEFVQKEISRASFPQRHHRQTYTSVASAQVAREGGLRVRWVDPDGKRNRLFVGLTAGTPAGLNLNFGYWGGIEVPLFAEVSGFYFDSVRRGFQGQVGWIADNRGALKQVLCMTLSALAQSSLASVDQLDELGRVVSTQSTTSYFLAPYLGPSYVGEWNQIRFQLGVGFGGFNPTLPAARAMFQVGYTFPVGF